MSANVQTGWYWLCPWNPTAADWRCRPDATPALPDTVVCGIRIPGFVHLRAVEVRTQLVPARNVYGSLSPRQSWPTVMQPHRPSLLSLLNCFAMFLPTKSSTVNKKHYPVLSPQPRGSYLQYYRTSLLLYFLNVALLSPLMGGALLAALISSSPVFEYGSKTFFDDVFFGPLLSLLAFITELAWL